MENEFIFNDERLSWRAKGLWSFMFLKKDDWKFNMQDLVNQSSDGKCSVRSGIAELEKLGYIKKNRIRESGCFKGVNYCLYSDSQKIRNKICT